MSRSSLSPIVSNRYHAGEKAKGEITVALADAPVGIELEKFLDGLLPERCCASEKEPHTAQVVLLEVVLAAEHANDNGGNLDTLATVDPGRATTNVRWAAG